MAQPARLNHIMVGDIRITYLPDGVTRLAPVEFLVGSTTERWKLHEEWLDNEGRLVASIGGLLIESGNRKVLVDTGFGAKHADIPPFGPFDGGELLKSFAAVGVDPGEVDTVAYTHLHLDHIGWTSKAAKDRERALTFPKARYVIRSAEWKHWAGRNDPAGPSVAEVEDPLRNRVDLIDADQSLAPGVTIVSTPGHTPGHSSFVISSGTQRAIILGDVVHCPVQLEEQEWSCAFDVDRALARATRGRLLAELEGSSTVGAGGHFSDFTFGRVMRAQGKRQWVVAAVEAAAR